MNNYIYFITIIIFTFLLSSSFAQTHFEPICHKKIDESIKFKTDAYRLIWANPEKDEESGYYKISGNTPKDFTCFGIGVGPSDLNTNYKNIQLEYKLGNGRWIETEADFTPNRIKRDNLFWTDLNFVPDASPENQIAVRVKLSNGLHLDSLKIQTMNMDFQEESSLNFQQKSAKATCPSYPNVISRSVWLDPYYTQSPYTPIQISAHHIVIHHGASPDTYTDGAAVVRSYWNYHVNSNGWNDIGYNYLTDKYGNIYKGRMNSDPLNQDCRGAHAGASNDESIGVNFLGNSDVTTPTTVQLDACYQLLGWWFSDRGYDPTASGNILLQSGGTGNVPRICGHKDVNIGGTSCPGNALYAELPLMRVKTKERIYACYSQPSTGIIVNNNWQTDDFSVSFQDVDSSGYGLEQKFWQVLEHDGNNWGANRNGGHFNDNFDSVIEPAWVQQSGTWAIDNSKLRQSDETNSNTNMYIPLRQVDTVSYLYHWQMQINGSGSNRRAGIHVFSDSASQSNRNNSYMVYYRVDQNEVHLYRYDSNVFTLVSQDYAVVDSGQWNDCKLYFNPSSGELKAWLNDQLVSEYTDSVPFTMGNYISLRTGNADVYFEDIKVYTSRNNAENVSVDGNNDMVRFENENPSSEACRIKSVVLDSLSSFSSVAGEIVNIDLSEPLCASVNDGLNQDNDYSYGLNEYYINWDSVYDPNSGINTIEAGLGTQAGQDDVSSFEPAAGNTHLFSALSLNNNQTYYASLRITNNAGLTSVVSSDGAIVTIEAIPDFTFSNTDICEGEYISFTNTSQYADSISWEFENASPAVSDSNHVNVSWDSSGTYQVSLTAWYGPNFNDTTVSISVDIHYPPLADFTASATSVDTSNSIVGFINNSQNADNYYWTFGDGYSSADENPWHIYQDTGVYSVSLNAYSTWCETDTLIKPDYIEVNLPNEISVASVKGVSLYPNPASEKISIIYERGKLQKIELVDESGKLVKIYSGDNLHEEIKSIDISGVSTGTYFVRLIPAGNSENGVITQKIQIIRD